MTVCALQYLWPLYCNDNVQVATSAEFTSTPVTRFTVQWEHSDDTLWGNLKDSNLLFHAPLKEEDVTVRTASTSSTVKPKPELHHLQSLVHKFVSHLPSHLPGHDDTDTGHGPGPEVSHAKLVKRLRALTSHDHVLEAIDDDEELVDALAEALDLLESLSENEDDDHPSAVDDDVLVAEPDDVEPVDDDDVTDITDIGGHTTTPSSSSQDLHVCTYIISTTFV